MKETGVWSFRTQTGIARVVNGSLDTRHTLRGIVLGTSRRIERNSLGKNLLAGLAAFGLLQPLQPILETVFADNLFAEIATIGLGSALAIAGMMLTFSLPVATILRPKAPVDIYDITAVTTDESDCELTVEYVDSDNTHGTTTIEVYDEDELDEAISILRLKGAPIEESSVGRRS